MNKLLKFHGKSDSSQFNRAKIGFSKRYPYWVYGIKLWISKRLHGILYTFTRHRSLFEEEIKEPLGISQFNSRERSRDNLDVAHKHLIDVSEDEFQIETPEDAASVYPIVTTILSLNGITRPSSFQARYSFCRSMWVTLLILLFSYPILDFFWETPWIVAELEYSTLILVYSFFLLLFMISA